MTLSVNELNQRIFVPSRLFDEEVPEQWDVVAISTHPDDVEIGMGATLAKMSEMGYKVLIVDVTNGEPTPYTKGPKQRLEESYRAAEILGVGRMCLDFPCRYLTDSRELREHLAIVFRVSRPSIVFNGLPTYPYANPDHGVASTAVDAAIFISRLTRWEFRYANTQPWRIPMIIYYETGRERVPSDMFASVFVVDVTVTFSRKIEALKAYESQFRYNPRGLSIVDWVNAHGKYWGAKIGAQYGEVFYSPSWIKIDDPLSLVRPNEF